MTGNELKSIMAKTAFVTGGTGFIGINLIELLTEQNWVVHALHRPSSDLTYLKKFPVVLKEGSITDYSSLLRAVPEDCEVIFHLAGDTNLWSKYNNRQTEVNVTGSHNMVKAAGEKHVKTFIHTSSTSAWGNMSGKKISESLPQKGAESWVNYERTKWASEQMVLNESPDDMKVVILNPATVTGPYDFNNWGRLFFALRDGDLPGIPDGIISVTHVREVAKAHLSAVDNGRKRERYILAGHDCRFSDFVREIAHVSGNKKLPRRIPTIMLKILAYIDTYISSIKGKEPDLTPELVKIMTRTNLVYSSSKAVKELGYTILPMEKCVQDCYEWLKNEGYF